MEPWNAHVKQLFSITYFFSAQLIDLIGLGKFVYPRLAMEKTNDEFCSFIRFRSPSFLQSEVDLLLVLVEKYKNPLLLKSSRHSVNYTKDRAWEKLATEFNKYKKSNEYERSSDVLRTKWENLKRISKQSSKHARDKQYHNVIVQKVIHLCESDVRPLKPAAWDDEQGPRTGKELRGQWANLRKSAKRDEQTRLDTGEGPYLKNPLHDRIVGLMQTKLNETATDLDNELLQEMQDEDSGDTPLASCNKGIKEQKFDASAFETQAEIRTWDGANENSDEENETESREDVSIVSRETQFTARDCRLLLHCVRQEKGAIFGDSSSVKKHTAWVRVSRLFNRQSPSKRQPSELKKKFQDLKSMATKINCATKILGTATKRRKRYEEIEELSDDTENRVQKKIKSEPKSDVTDELEDDSDTDGGSQDVSLHSRNDPLSNGVSVDSGLGFTSLSDNNSLEKLRIELLTYEMETAKLQRKRIEDAIAAEKLEASLRLRSARLEMQAAEAKLPLSHSALAYTAAEALAREYMAYSVP